MRRCLIRASIVVGLLLALQLPMVAGTADGESAAPGIDWLDGATGYREGLSVAEQSGKPMLLYFYTDWCPYCRQLNRELLSAAEVQMQIGEMVAVRVNPESGADEQALAARYGVRGFPALYVYSAAEGGLQAVRRTVGEAGGVRLKTPEEFAATLASASR